MSYHYPMPSKGSKMSIEEEKNLYLDRPMKGKSQEQLRRHQLEASIDNKPIERSLHILTMGDDAQKISVINSLPHLITLDSAAVYNRIIPKIKQDLPSSSCEFQIATSSVFMLLLQQSGNSAILQSILSGLDSKDPNVAYAWSQALFGAMASLPEVMLQNQILPLAKQRFQPNATVLSKVFCAKLMGEICSRTKFRMIDVKRDIMPIVNGLSQDRNPDVRAQMCSCLPRVVAILGNEWEKTNILSCIVDLAQDENIKVRSTSILAIASMMKILTQDASKNTLLPLIKNLCTKACEESSVCALILSDEFGGLMLDMPYIDTQDMMFFIHIYKQLSIKGKQATSTKANASMEVTIRQRCATNTLGIMKLVLLTIPAQIPEVYGTFRDHAIDPCYLVRKAAAGVLADIAQLLGKDNKIMKNEIVRLLRDDAVEVLDALIPTISSLFTSLANHGAISYTETTQTTIELCKALIKCQTELSKRYNWRLTIQFIKQLEVLPTCVPSDYIHNNFTPNLFDKLIFGKAKPVRKAAASTLVVFMRYNFQSNQCKWIRDSLIRQTSQSRSCHSRILYFDVCAAVLSVYSEKYFKEFFLGPCLQLAQDRIPNIRWKFIQFSTKLKSMVTLSTDLQSKNKISDAISRLESAERTKTVLDIIKVKKRDPLPKYSSDALREEDIRVREEATTNIKKVGNSLTKIHGPLGTGVKKPQSVSPPEMPFLEQHFYIDAGIKLESIINISNSSEIDSDTHLDTSDLIPLDSCNITDDAKVNLRNNLRGTSKFLVETSRLESALSRNTKKRHSSIFSHECLQQSKLPDKLGQRRHSLNFNHYSESKIPIANRSKLYTIIRNTAKENTNENSSGAWYKHTSRTKSLSALPVYERRTVPPSPKAKSPAGRGR